MNYGRPHTRTILLPFLTSGNNRARRINALHHVSREEHAPLVLVPVLPAVSKDESALYHFDPRCSGKEHNLHEQIRRMPGTGEKIKAFIYCFAAVSEIQTGQSNQSAGIKIRAWWKRWKMQNAPHNPSTIMLLLSWRSWCGANVKMLIRKR